MKKTLILSLSAIAVLSASQTDGTAAVGKMSGYIRTAYVGNDYAAGGNDYATAVGGVLKYETQEWFGLKLGTAAYASQKVGFMTGEGVKTNGDFFDENKKSYAYVGEAYVEYKACDFSFRTGRQLLDTPLADTDDIRMHPNTFEAAVATYSGIKGTVFTGGYVTRWAGFDSGEDKSTFKKLDGAKSDGVAVVGVLNESIEHLFVQGWYYGIDRVADAFYGDAVYTMAFSEAAGGELSVQYASFDEENGSAVDGHVYGLGLRADIGVLTLGAAYNRASNDEGKAVVNGFGGGPYFTSMEEWTIDGMEDAKAYQLSTELDMGFTGFKDLSVIALYGVFKSTPLDIEIKEWDIILDYPLSGALSLDASYAKITDSNTNADGGADAGYSRFLTRINYDF